MTFQEIAPAAYLSTFVNVPIPFHRRAWRCHFCGSEWADDGTDAGALQISPRTICSQMAHQCGPFDWQGHLAQSGQSKYAWLVSSSGESYLNEQRERRRLAENYAGLTDDELLRLARNAESSQTWHGKRLKKRWTAGT